MIRFIPPLGGNGDALTSPPRRLTLTVFTCHSLSEVYFNSLNSKLVLTEQHLVVKAWVRITMLLRDRRQSVVLSSTISPVHCLLLYFSQVWDDTAHNQTLNRFVHPQGAKTSSWVIYLKMDLGNFRSVMEHYPPAGKGLETPSVRWWTASPQTWKALPNKARPGQTALALVLCQSVPVAHRYVPETHRLIAVYAVKLNMWRVLRYLTKTSAAPCLLNPHVILQKFCRMSPRHCAGIFE